MVRAAAVAGQGAAEIAGGEKSHLVFNADRHQRVIKRANGGADLRKHRRLVIQNIVVVITSTPLHKESLPNGAQGGPSLNGPRYHSEPAADIGIWESDTVRQRRRAGRGEGLVSIECLLLSSVERLGQKIGVL